MVAAPVHPEHAAAQGTGGGLTSASFVQTWTSGALVQDKGAPIAESSPSPATLDATGPAVVVGDRAGYVYAFHLADGTPVPGWPVFDGGAPIDSTPSTASLAPNGLDDVFVGAGNAQFPRLGGYLAYGPGGEKLWQTNVVDPPGDAKPAYGVQASITVTDLQGSPELFAGSLDQESFALDAASGTVLPGWPFFSADSIFSTAAAASLYGDGQEELVVGGASTAGLAMGVGYSNGGHVRVINGQGHLVYDYDTNQEVDSSPAIGDFLVGGTPGIVVGTGSHYQQVSDTDTLKAFTTRLGLVWSATLDGVTTSSPALADVTGTSQLEVVEGTDTGTGGSVWVLNGATGTPIWHEPVTGRVIGSVVAANLTGNDYDDLLVPTTHGVDVLDGQSGAEIAVLGKSYGFQNAPLVTNDPNGTVGITIAGYNGDNEGVVTHYEVPGSNGALAVGAGSWPMFHHDSSLSGTSSPLPDVGTVSPANLTAQAGLGQVTLSWSAPAVSGAGPATGYNIYQATAPGHEQGSPINTAPVTGTRFSVAGLRSGTRYYFEVTALNAGGEGSPSNEVNAVPLGPPGAPTGLVAAPGAGQVTLSWAAPASNGGSPVTAYNIYESTTSGVQGLRLVSVAASVRSYTVVGLQGGSPYFFEVTAVNGNGEGPPSAQVATTLTAGTSPPPTTPPPPVPAAPTGLVATAGNGQVTLSWTAPAPASGTGSVTGYDIYESTVAGAQGSQVATSTSTSATVTGLRDGTTYYFEVTAVNGGGQSLPSPQVPALPAAPAGYRLVAADGQVSAFGHAVAYKVPAPAQPVVALTPTPDGRGYWLVLQNGAIVAAGDARGYGSMAGRHLNSPVAGIAATPDGAGYWIVCADGGLFAFGDARFYGSLGSVHLRRPVVGIAAMPDGRGYWMVSSDGGIFAFGDAHYYGSTGSKRLNQPVVGIAATPDGRGYWMVSSDGGIFAFGDAPFFGSLGSKPSHVPVVGIAA